MATVIMSAAGAALGGSLGGSVLGLSMTAVGRLAGASLGRAIDQRLLGEGSQAVETGQVDRFRLTGSGEGDPIAQAFGRVRVAGHVIWATRFAESVTTSGGGKGMAPRPETRDYSYSVSLAVALCEGEITGVSRIWADGVEIARDDLNMRVYTGSAAQQPDSLLEAVEGAGQVPAYRGTAYVVFEDLPLGQFGNRVPQFNFEVLRAAPTSVSGAAWDPAHAVEGVALLPGSGEYALATSPVYLQGDLGKTEAANVNSPSGQSDFVTSLRMLEEELPKVGATSLVVSWFGDDLRCAECNIRPKVEQNDVDGRDMPWSVCAETRATAQTVARDGQDRPIYGGTPADAAVIEAIEALNARGQAVMYYPFILMEQTEGNALPDPYSEATVQPSLPWRGRITLSTAPGRAGTPDATDDAAQEVADFFGSAGPQDFTVSDGVVTYSGPQEWRYRRFVLHQAALCAAAGGVDSFCIGSEMRGLTWIRSSDHSFPAVEALRQLAADVRTILGPEVKVGYAADWSEYSAYQSPDGNLYFHLDALWSDENIDFIGIDNYMPLSDWRDGDTHADARWGSIYELAYLRENIAGGEGYDWYYHSPEAEAAQIRTPITDGAHHEPWVYKFKDIRSWWASEHHNRIAGVRESDATPWQPQSKPIWFTEYGCGAVDKGTNQPNRFLDAKSSESMLPRASDGQRDELIQLQYLRATTSYWAEPENNPASTEYDGAMVDMSRAFVWAWDARPWPHFPNDRDTWSDGDNYARGHWITGRSVGRTLASVVAEICDRAGLRYHDTSTLYGYVRGYVISDVSDARAALQPLMLRYAFDAVERDGMLIFRHRDGARDVTLSREGLAVESSIDGLVEENRASEAELIGRVRLRFSQAEADYARIAEEAVLPQDETHAVSSTETALVMTRGEGRQVVERWLAEARIARDSLRLALPPSRGDVGPGDVIELDEGACAELYRVDRVERGTSHLIEAVRIDPQTYHPVPVAQDVPPSRNFVAPVPVWPVFMDLPLMSGAEVAHAPHIALTADPWPGSAAVYDAATDSDYRLNTLVAARATMGQTTTALAAGPIGVFDRGNDVIVRLASGALSSVSEAEVLNGANLAAIGDGSTGTWELVQFRDATLVGQDTYLLQGLLRGQQGSDAVMPDAWPPGSIFVLLNGIARQIEMPLARRGLAHHYRIGPATRGYDDPSYEHIVTAFEGIGLRPWRPCHLRIARNDQGDIGLSWIRRTRIDGDSWLGHDVPLGEDSETYLVRVRQDGAILREVTTLAPDWTYTQSMQAADAVVLPYQIEVAQVSASFGAGPFQTITVSD